VPYWWRHPQGMMDSLCTYEGEGRVTRIDNSDGPMAWRRWSAFRVSWWARDYLQQS
jgi:hypothetical protein